MTDSTIDIARRRTLRLELDTDLDRVLEFVGDATLVLPTISHARQNAMPLSAQRQRRETTMEKTRPGRQAGRFARTPVECVSGSAALAGLGRARPNATYVPSCI